VRGESGVQKTENGLKCLWERKLSVADRGSFLTVDIEDPENTVIILDLGMKPRLTGAHVLVEEDCNQVAVERGPLVYCLEGMDAPAETIDELFVPSDVRFKPEEIEIEGRKVTGLAATFLKKIHGPEYDRNSLYQDYSEEGYEPVPVRMIPYFAWDNRGLNEMRIWMPVVRNRFGSEKQG